jgi:hypothetical protein
MNYKIREELGSLPNCAWDVDQGVCAVQSGEEVLVSMHKPLLYTSLLDWKQEAQPAELLKLKHGYAVALCHFPDVRLAEDSLRSYGRHSIEGVVYDPVEHFYQEGVFLEDARKEIVSEARGIRCMNDKATYPPCLWESGCYT